MKEKQEEICANCGHDRKAHVEEENWCQGNYDNCSCKKFKAQLVPGTSLGKKPKGCGKVVYYFICKKKGQRTKVPVKCGDSVDGKLELCPSCKLKS
ncbi:unnamed protein product [marine sediment metagenome]|uniref:Uncharacterized protein n=1 Tax=marine sediment metagenome TaxID=412755 RepID=X1GW20_9ZZZZ